MRGRLKLLLSELEGGTTTKSLLARPGASVAVEIYARFALCARHELRAWCPLEESGVILVPRSRLLVTFCSSPHLLFTTFSL